VQDIINRVGVSEPTFFNYFPSKEAVLEEFAVRTLDRFLDLVRVELEDTNRSARDKVGSLLTQLAEAFRKDRRFMAVVATRSSLFWGARGGVLERELGLYELLTDLFERGQRSGEVRPDIDPQRLAETFTGAYMLALVNWLVGWWGKRDDLTERLLEVGDVLLDGCTVRPVRTRKHSIAQHTLPDRH
jgi:AcrR family transcriptional regulator